MRNSTNCSPSPGRSWCRGTAAGRSRAAASKERKHHMPTWEIPNGVAYKPELRGWQPREAPPEWRAPDVAAPDIKIEGTVVARLHAAIKHANKEFQKHLA